MSRRDERGFTLIELLVGIAITSVIAGVMVEAMFVGLRTMDETNARVAGSNDTQLVAGVFTPDVASATAISTTGTKSHEAPGVSPSVASTRVVWFWSLNSATTVTVQSGMSQAWNLAASRFRVVMADEAAPNAAATGTRGASSTVGTSSLTHSVALAPAVLSTVARRAASSGTTAGAGAQTLTVTKPTGTAQNDRLLAHVAVVGGPTTSVSAPGWTLVNSRDSGTNLKSLVFQKLATNAEPLSYVFSFKNAAGTTAVTREAAIGIAAYSGVATAVCSTPGPGCGLNRAALDMNPCGGETPVLLLSWADRHFVADDDVDIEVAYNATPVGKETHLVRSRCSAPSGGDMSGTPASAQTLATSLASGSAYASCVSSVPASGPTTTAVAPVDNCALLPVTVTVSVSETPSAHQPNARTYLLRASTRTDRSDG